MNQKARRNKFSETNSRESSAIGFTQKEPESVNLSRFWILPNNIRNKMRYITRSTLLNLVGNSASRQFSANGLYDIDPLLASTAMPGFTELMNIYQNYRVVSCRVKGFFSNNEARPMTLNVTFTGINSYVTNNFIASQYGNKFSKQYQIGAKGGEDTCAFENQVNNAALFGSTAYWGDVTQFLGTGATNPTTPLNVNLACAAFDAAFVNLGVSFNLEMEYVVEFSNMAIFQI
jgi:hypothetical protein